jgi:hypothetical protein
MGLVPNVDVVTLCPAIFDGYVLALRKTGFVQASVKCGHLMRERLPQSGMQKPDDRHRLLRARASGQAAAAPPSSVMKSRRFMCGWPPPGKRKCSVPHRSRLQSCVRPVHAVRRDCWP